MISKRLTFKITGISQIIAKSILSPQSYQRRHFNMEAVEAVLSNKYPAKAHAKRVVEYIKKKNPNANGVLYLEGQKTRMIEDNDGEAPFRYIFTSLKKPPLISQLEDSVDTSTT
jgi:hypothetical protein